MPLAEPPQPMATKATSDGLYAPPATGAELPRAQILTIGGPLAGTERARYPDLASRGLTINEAKRDAGSAKRGGLF